MMTAISLLAKKFMDWIGKRRWLTWLLRAGVTGLVLLWVLSFIDFEQFKQITVSPAWMPLAGMVLFAWLFVFIGAVKFWYMFKAIAPVPFGRFIVHFLVATSIGTFTPASVGDFSLAAFLKHEQIPVHQSVSVILVDRVITVSIYGVIFLPLTLGLLLRTAQLWWVPSSFVAIGLLTLIANGNEKLRVQGQRLLEKLRWPFLTNFVMTTSDLLRAHPWTLIGNVALTLLRCLTAGLVVQCALYAAGEFRSFLPVVLATNSISLLNLLPVSLAGLGIYEGGGVMLFSRLGFDPERVLAALIYQRVYVIIYSLVMLAATYLLTVCQGQRLKAS
ncbi:MAG TPA: lysylphosphatidylglycerol synthase transmembrane domain-containing protein [Anaerolineales bacterium]|nr:lysylphosphatidylglycerol synthase transmembrane domain-containing protein [Anaerolineales bacterium]